jgi:hypothetical protein
MIERIHLNELISLVREKYKLDESCYDITPSVDFGDYGDGVEFTDIYFDIRETLQHYNQRTSFSGVPVKKEG